MIKSINRQNILVSPFVAKKSWELANVLNPDVVLDENPSTSDLPIASEYVDYYDNPATLNSECDIALEQQDADSVIYQEGISGSGLINPVSEPKNLDGTLKRIVYSQTKSAFYRFSN